jgi:heat shock protein HslJ
MIVVFRVVAVFMVWKNRGGCVICEMLEFWCVWDLLWCELNADVEVLFGVIYVQFWMFVLWTWVSSTQNGTTTSAPSGGKFVLTFGKDKRLSSTTDCNGVGGEYEVEKNNTLSFSKFMSTLMFCEGSMEQTYTSQLMKTSSYSLSSSTLLLTGSSGTMTFTKK